MRPSRTGLLEGFNPSEVHSVKPTVAYRTDSWIALAQAAGKLVSENDWPRTSCHPEGVLCKGVKGAYMSKPLENCGSLVLRHTFCQDGS